VKQPATGRIVFLSPHLDDATLSCGGLIASASDKESIEIWTLFCSAPVFGSTTPLTAWLHGASGASSGRQLSRMRKMEDEAACRVLQVNCRHFSWADAVYRKDRNGSPLYSTTRQDTWNPADQKVLEDISATLRDRLGPDDVVVSPAGIGRHVDHLIARRAAELAAEGRVAYYVEVPYIDTAVSDLSLQTSGLDATPYDLPEQSVRRWLDAVACYRSQIPLLEKTTGAISSLIVNRGLNTQYLYGDAARIVVDRMKPRGVKHD
jgi:LmbE family N-acetylglucosaminyl deacetylase